MSPPVTTPPALEPLTDAPRPSTPVQAGAAVSGWSVAAVLTPLIPADSRMASVRSRLDAWQAADGAARNAERRIDEDTRACLLAGGPGPSGDLLHAALKLRSIATERLERLRDAFAPG